MSASSQPSPEDSENGRYSIGEESETNVEVDIEKESNEIAEGTTYDVLSNKRRRYVVYLLKQDTGRITIGEMAERVAAWEYGISVQELTGDQRKRVYTALQQTHLPLMDDAALIEFNKDRGIITPKSTVHGIEVYQESAADETNSWSKYYLGLSSANVLLVLGSLSGIPLLGSVSMSVLTGALMAVFLASSVGHWFAHREEQAGADGRPPEVTREAGS